MGFFVVWLFKRGEKTLGARDFPKSLPIYPPNLME